jgi:hypothetical protein
MPTDPENKVLPGDDGVTSSLTPAQEIERLRAYECEAVAVAMYLDNRHVPLQVNERHLPLVERVAWAMRRTPAPLRVTIDAILEDEKARRRATMTDEAAPAWTIEVNDRLPGGRRLVLLGVERDVRADVALVPARAYVTFGGTRWMRSRVACLLAAAAIIRHVDDNPVRCFGNRITPGDYTIQIAGPESWEILRSVFGDVYAAAVL